MNWYRSPIAWSFIFKNYLPRLVVCSLVWEIAQLPLYSIWNESSLAWIAYAVMHCTTGDALIGTSALLIALTVNRAGNRAAWPIFRIGAGTVAFAVAYTVLSERLNLTFGNWSYSPWMPVVPWIEVGVAPILQWIFVPLISWWLATRHGVNITSQPCVTQTISDR